MKLFLSIRKWNTNEFDLARERHNEKLECAFFSFSLLLSFFFSPTLPVLHVHTHIMSSGALIRLSASNLMQSEWGAEAERWRERERKKEWRAHSKCQYMWSINVVPSINWRTTVLHTHTYRFDDDYTNKREGKKRTEELHRCFFSERIQEPII